MLHTRGRTTEPGACCEVGDIVAIRCPHDHRSIPAVVTAPRQPYRRGHVRRGGHPRAGGRLFVRNSLKRSVRKHVEFRNDLAHADWTIGWTRVDTSEPIPASAHKIKSRDGVPRFSNLNIQTNEIIYNINDLNKLRVYIQKFGSGCLARQRQLDQRVSDLLEPFPEADSGRTLVREKT